MKFKSQICTTREQSERLIALGLKKETADMFWMEEWKFNEKTNEPYFTGEYLESIKRSNKWVDLRDSIPAWSLHRIMSMVYSCRAKKNGLRLAIIRYDNPFEDMIQQIEWLIKEGYFNKEYLE